MASGPKRAPDLKETASSVGTPTTATSTPSVSATWGSRMKVRGPVKRGVSEESAGRWWTARGLIRSSCLRVQAGVLEHLGPRAPGGEQRHADEDDEARQQAEDDRVVGVQA